MPEVTLQYFDGCPHWRLADERLQALAGELGFTLRHQRIDTPEEARAWDFRGSPSILVDGRDPFPGRHEDVGLSCRTYPTPDGPAGSPTSQQLREALS